MPSSMARSVPRNRRESVSTASLSAAVLLEDPREPGDDGVAAPRDLAVLVLDLGVRREQGAERLRVLLVVGLDERGEQVGDGPDVGLPLL